MTDGSGFNHREYSVLEADRLGIMLGLVGLFYFLNAINIIQKTFES